MKIINEALLDETTGRAKQSPRLRMNYNFHERLDDPVNRLLNALEPGTYLRPHRHLNPAKDEIFLCFFHVKIYQRKELCQWIFHGSCYLSCLARSQIQSVMFSAVQRMIKLR